MASLFRQPDAPREDPDIKRLRDQEEKRSEADRITSIQEQLSVETRLRRRGFGLRSLLGSLGSFGKRARSLLGAG